MVKQTEETDGLIRRSYYTTAETHALMEQGAADNETKIYVYLAAALEAFDPKRNPEHKAMLDKHEKARKVADLTRQMSDMPADIRKAVIRNLTK